MNTNEILRLFTETAETSDYYGCEYSDLEFDIDFNISCTQLG